MCRVKVFNGNTKKRKAHLQSIPSKKAALVRQGFDEYIPDEDVEGIDGNYSEEHPRRSSRQQQHINNNMPAETSGTLGGSQLSLDVSISSQPASCRQMNRIRPAIIPSDFDDEPDFMAAPIQVSWPALWVILRHKFIPSECIAYKHISVSILCHELIRNAQFCNTLSYIIKCNKM